MDITDLLKPGQQEIRLPGCVVGRLPENRMQIAVDYEGKLMIYTPHYTEFEDVGATKKRGLFIYRIFRKNGEKYTEVIPQLKDTTSQIINRIANSEASLVTRLGQIEEQHETNPNSKTPPALHNKRDPAH